MSAEHECPCVSRRGILAVAAILAVIGGCLFWLYFDNQPEPVDVGVNLKGYHFIKLGMTLAEIEKILGKPAGYLEPTGYVRGIGTTWYDREESTKKMGPTR